MLSGGVDVPQGKAKLPQGAVSLLGVASHYRNRNRVLRGALE